MTLLCSVLEAESWLYAPVLLDQVGCIGVGVAAEEECALAGGERDVRPAGEVQ